MDQDERDQLAALADGWDTRAAELERTRVLEDHARLYRQHAAQLRDLLGTTTPRPAGRHRRPGNPRV